MSRDQSFWGRRRAGVAAEAKAEAVAKLNMIENQIKVLKPCALADMARLDSEESFANRPLPKQDDSVRTAVLREIRDVLREIRDAVKDATT